MRKWNHACSLLVCVISVFTPRRQRSLTAFRRYYLLKTKLSDRRIKQLLNSVIAKYRDLLATGKSRYFARPRPIIANYFRFFRYYYSGGRGWGFQHFASWETLAYKLFRGSCSGHLFLSGLTYIHTYIHELYLYSLELQSSLSKRLISSRT